MRPPLTSPLLLGAHLGLLQAGYLLTLQRAVSAAHTTYALVIVAWLVGGACGLWVGLSLRRTVALGLAAYIVTLAGLGRVDFAAVDPAWFAPAIAASGLASGRYFAVAVEADAALAPLFARETYGFLAGTLAAAVGFAFLGRHALWVLPLVSGLAALLRRPSRPR